MSNVTFVAEWMNTVNTVNKYSFRSIRLMQGWRNFLSAHAQIVKKEILSRAQVDVPLSLSHSCVWPHSCAL